MQGNTLDKDAVILRIEAGHAMVDITAATGPVKTDNGPGHISADIEGITAQPADNIGQHISGGAQDIEGVITFHAIDFGNLDIIKTDIQTGAVNAIAGNYKTIVCLGTEHHHGIGAGAPIDGQRGIDGIKNRIVTSAAIEFGITAARNLIGPGAQEGSDRKFVVPFVAVHLQQRFVAIHREAIFSRSTVNNHRLANTATQITEGGFDGVDFFARGHIRLLSVGTEQLADLETVVTSATIESGHAAVVVAVKGIRTIQTVNPQARIDVLIVIDTLHIVGETISHRAVQVSHEIVPQQKAIILVGAVHGQAIGAIGKNAGVCDIDDVIGCAGSVDGVIIRAALTVQVKTVGSGQQAGDGDMIVSDTAKNAGVPDEQSWR